MLGEEGKRRGGIKGYRSSGMMIVGGRRRIRLAHLSRMLIVASSNRLIFGQFCCLVPLDLLQEEPGIGTLSFQDGGRYDEDGEFQDQ